MYLIAIFFTFICNHIVVAKEPVNLGADLDQWILDYEEAKNAKPVEEEKTILETLDELHTDITEEIVSDAEKIDSFFVNDRVTDGHNQTNLRIINNASMIERQGFNDTVDFRFRLRLPKLEEKLQFEIGQQVDDYSTGNNKGSTQNSPLRNQDRAARAGFSFFKDLFGIKSKLTSGVRYKSGIVPYANFRLSRDFALSKKAKISIINDLFYDHKDRSGDRGTLYYDYAFSKKLVWRLINEAVYRDLDYTFQTVNGFAFFYQFSDTSLISYSAVVNAINPHYQHVYYASSYQTSITYRHLAYKNYVYFEYAPAVSFPKVIDFRRQLEFYFRIEVIFGKI